MEHSPTFFSLIPGIKNFPDYLVAATFVFIILIILSVYFYFKIRAKDDLVIPDKGITLRNFFETLGEFISSMTFNIMGDKNKKFIPLIGTTFIYIFLSNLLGLIPGFSPPTSNIHTNAACALVVFLTYNFYGIKEHGIGYLKQFVGPAWWLAILFIPAELASHLARPFSLTLRLFGNMFGEHVAAGIFSGLIPFLVPIFFMLFGLFAAFLQAFIFAILSVLYINVATSHDH